LNIKDIAKLAGVSVATVSRVLNHPEVVQLTTRDHVLKVMKEYNYTPNWFARSLNLDRTNTLALMIPNIENEMFQKITAGIEQIAHKKNYTILLCNTHNNIDTEEKYLDMIITRKVDGIIFATSTLSEKHIKDLNNLKIPFVFIGKNDVFNKENTCYINFEESANKITHHLLEMNQDNIDLVIDESSNSKNRYIIKGYEKAMTSFNHKIGNIHYCKNSIEGGYLTAKRLINTGQLPKVIFASEDEIAFGIMKAAREEKINIPEELALSGFSNSPMGTLVVPELTSVDQPSKKLGMVAARMLFDLIEDVDFASDMTQEIILQSTIKIRKSCGNKKYIYELFK
jgi:LacI family transcriptional regulator